MLKLLPLPLLILLLLLLLISVVPACASPRSFVPARLLVCADPRYPVTSIGPPFSLRSRSFLSLSSLWFQPPIPLPLPLLLQLLLPPLLPRLCSPPLPPPALVYACSAVRLRLALVRVRLALPTLVLVLPLARSCLFAPARLHTFVWPSLDPRYLVIAVLPSFVLVRALLGFACLPVQPSCGFHLHSFVLSRPAYSCSFPSSFGLRSSSFTPARLLPV